MLRGKTEVQDNARPVSLRLVRMLIPITLAVLLFGLLVWPGLAFDFSFRFRLSTLQPTKAFNPDIAARGGYLAVVWSEGYNADSTTKQYGRIYLKGGDETTGWKGRVELFEANNTEWGRDPSLAFDPNVPGKVHVVWVQASGCPSCNWSSIRYAACTLGDKIVCDLPTTLVSGLGEASTPEVAVDASGGVHVVWREGPTTGIGPIRYCRRGSCSPSTIDNGQDPSLAYANGSLHLVWDTGSADNSTIKYERDIAPGDNSWVVSGSQTWWANPPLSIPYHDPSYPAVAASNDAVYVVWAVRNKSDSSKFALAFDRSLDTGATWLAGTSGFGHSIPGNQIADFASTWRSTHVELAELYSLQPTVVVTGSGSSAYAHVAWHAKDVNSGFYKIWYSYLAGYSDAATWHTPDVAVQEGTRSAGFPGIAVGTSLDQTHLAYVRDATAAIFRDINVFYTGGNDNRSLDPDDKIRFPLIQKNR